MSLKENLFANCNFLQNGYEGTRQFIWSALSMGPSYHFILYRHMSTLSHVSNSVSSVHGLSSHNFKYSSYSAVRTYGRVASIFNYHDAAVAHGLKYHSLNEIHNFKIQCDCYFKGNNGRRIPIIEQLLPLELSVKGKVLTGLIIHTDVSHINYRPRKTIDLIHLCYNHISYRGIEVPENGDMLSSLSGLLSQRELDVLHFIAEGLDSKSIGEKLNLSQETIKTHRKNMLRKSGRSTMYQIVSDAFREGILS